MGFPEAFLRAILFDLLNKINSFEKIINFKLGYKQQKTSLSHPKTRFLSKSNSRNNGF